MTRKSRLGLSAAPAALAALLGLAAPSLAQDLGGKGEEPKPAVEEKVLEEAPPELRGSRYKLVLKSKAEVEGILPQGLRWEKLDESGEYVEAKETDKGAGVRLYYVLNMEGDIFIARKEITEIKDLGALSDEQRAAMKEKILAARRKALAEKEKIHLEEMKRIGDAVKEAEEKAEAEGKAKRSAEDSKKAAKEEKDRARGDELLKKFPPPEWGEEKKKTILTNGVTNGIFPTVLEQEFIDNFDLWKEAAARAEKAKEKEEGGDGEKKEEKKEEKKGYGGEGGK